MNAIVHWHKAMIVRRAAKALSEYDISCAVITKHRSAPSGIPWFRTCIGGWDYTLIRRDWGPEYARRYQQQYGGWILPIKGNKK